MNAMTLRKDMRVDGAQLLQRLGTGTSGEVWSALEPDGTLVALKIYAGSEEVRTKAEHEYCMARCFESAHTLKPLSLSDFRNHPIIRLPYCEGRSVDGIAAHFNEKMLWQLIAQVSHALMEIHGRGYAHFDIKPSNILWDGTAFILSDFGSCTSLHQERSEEASVDESSYRFDAPEVSTQRMAASDIWALGATVFFLYMGCHVFNGLGGRAQRKDSPIPYMRKSLPVLSNLVQRCLAYNPDDRPSAEEINALALKELKKAEISTTERHSKSPEKRHETNHTSDYWPDGMVEG